MRRVWDRLVFSSRPPEPGERPLAAVLAPLYEDASGDMRLILTKRPMTMPTHAGHLSFPGGRPHPGDDGPVGTALREAQEEMGIEPASVEVLGFLPAVDTVQFSLLVVPVVGRLPPTPTLVPSEREVDKVLTPRVADLADDSRWRSEDWRGRTVWFYDIEDEVLWGATAWMTRNMLGLPV
jgi:8-oxo-dGTP pyrophosphatase MutT (NUDIX family)